MASDYSRVVTILEPRFLQREDLEVSSPTIPSTHESKQQQRNGGGLTVRRSAGSQPKRSNFDGRFLTEFYESGAEIFRKWRT